MDTLLSWAQGLVFAAIAAGIVCFISPDSAIDKAVKTVAAVFMLCALVSPLAELKDVNFEGAFSEEAEDVNSDELLLEIYEEAELLTVKCIEETLEKEGVRAVSVRVKKKSAEDGAEYICGAEAVIENCGKDKALLEKAVFESTGIKVEIRTE